MGTSGVIRLAIFILIFVSSGAFAGNPIKNADSLLSKMYNKVDYDTTYISRSPGKIGLKLWGSLSGSRLKARGDNLNSTLRPDMKGSVSVEFDYYDLALDIGTSVTGFSGSKRDFSINFNFYPRRFVFDFSYQKTWSASGSVTYNDQTVDVEADWLVTKMLNIDIYYTFNYRKFSYNSPFYQLHVQKKSAGSWLAGFSYQGGSIKSTDKVPGNLPQLHLKNNHFGIGGGYAYNLVAGKKWLFHLSVIPNLMVWTNNTIERDGEKLYTKTKFPTVLMNGRAGAVYFFNQRHFVGLFGVASSLFKSKSETELMESEWMIRMFYGTRI